MPGDGDWKQVGENISKGKLGTSNFTEIGYSVASNSDGSIVAVGGTQDDESNSGEILVYELVSGNWTKVGESLYTNRIIK